jgi:hypothetical protein
VGTHDAVEHSGLWSAAGIAARGRRRRIGGEHVRRGGEAGTMPLGRAHDLGGLERDLRRGRPPVGRSTTRCPDPGQDDRCKSPVCASTRRERSAVTSGLPRGSLPCASVSTGDEAAAFDIGAVPQTHPAGGARSPETALAPNPRTKPERVNLKSVFSRPRLRGRLDVCCHAAATRVADRRDSAGGTGKPALRKPASSLQDREMVEALGLRQ